MSFPLDPNAPGGPRRSEYLRRSFAGASEPLDAQEDDSEVTVRVEKSQDVAAPVSRVGRESTVALRRLEARLTMAVFGA
jgi:hypothetical protein